METFEVKPHWVLDERYNDEGRLIDGQIVVKTIKTHIKNDIAANWAIVVVKTLQDAKDYFKENISGRNEDSFLCFMTSKFMLEQALENKFPNIKMEWLPTTSSAVYHIMLFQK